MVVVVGVTEVKQRRGRQCRRRRFHQRWWVVNEGRRTCPHSHSPLAPRRHPPRPSPSPLVRPHLRPHPSLRCRRSARARRRGRGRGRGGGVVVVVVGGCHERTDTGSKPQLRHHAAYTVLTVPLYSHTASYNKLSARAILHENT